MYREDAGINSYNNDNGRTDDFCKMVKESGRMMPVAVDPIKGAVDSVRVVQIT